VRDGAWVNAHFLIFCFEKDIFMYFFDDLTLIPHTNRPFWCGPKIASIAMEIRI
tara:strand:- start:310 stop:471 length:162 start_codon:yes stop_codon:yes gene_type:complete